MKATLISISSVAILGIVGYFGYQAFFTTPVQAPQIVDSSTQSSSSSAQIPSAQTAAKTSTLTTGATSANMCDYLTPELMAKYVAVPVERDPDGEKYSSLSTACFYHKAGAKPGVSGIANLQSIYANLDQSTSDKIFAMHSSSKYETVDTSFGFRAWYTNSSTKDGSANLFFMSKGYVMSIVVEAPKAGAGVNLKSAENIAREIEAKL